MRWSTGPLIAALVAIGLDADSASPAPPTPSSPGESMKTHHRPLVYRIVAAHSWPAEGLRTNTVQREILAASLEGTVVAPEAPLMSCTAWAPSSSVCAASSI